MGVVLNHTSYIGLLVLSAAITAMLAVLSWRRSADADNPWFPLLMLAVAEWALMRVFEGSAVTIPTKLLWGKIGYLGVVSIPPLWLRFAMTYSEHPWRWQRRR